MEELRNLNQDDVLEYVLNPFPLTPMFNGVFITMNRVEPDGTLDMSDNILDDQQYVVSVGPTAQVEVGNKVLIDIEKMMVDVKVETVDAYQTMKQVKIDMIEVDGKQFALITDRIIKAKDNR